MKTRNTLAIVLLAIGSLQMLGALCGNRILRGIGLASGIAPYTKVFCAADGYEAFAATFTISGTLPGGTHWERLIDPYLYARLRGPYNRRNVYGATLAFAPRLPVDLRTALLDEALAPGSALRSQLAIPAGIGNLQITIIPRHGSPQTSWTYPQTP